MPKIIKINQIKDFEKEFKISLSADYIKNSTEDLVFQIDFTQGGNENVDVSMLFYYYLILNKLKSISSSRNISIEVYLPQKLTSQNKEDASDYFEISAYSFIQENKGYFNSKNAKIYLKNGGQLVSPYGKKFQQAPLNGIRKHLPIITVNKDSFAFLSMPAGEKWNEIKNYDVLKLNSMENIVLYLCGNALFGDTGIISLRRIRNWIFSSPLFEAAIAETSILALLIFSLYDLHLRKDMASKYRLKINKRTLTENMFFNEFQMEQEWREYKSYCELKLQDGDIKTFLEKEDKTEGRYSYRNFNIFSERAVEEIVDQIDQIEKRKAGKLKNALSGVLRSFWVKRGNYVDYDITYHKICEVIKETLKTDGNDALNCYLVSSGFQNIVTDILKRFEEHIKEEFKHFSLHPQIIKELYESIIVSEGMLQLMENIVRHEGNSIDNGTGVMDIRILSSGDYNDDKVIKKYFENKDTGSQTGKIKYWMEIKIADLSMTSIPTKFFKNNEEVINKIRRVNLDAANRLENLDLYSFFKPETDSDIKAWDAFYNFDDEENDRMVNHFGLQIFDSIVNSKGGTFSVSSLDLEFEKISEHIKIPGTMYHILLPLDERTKKDDNIYDTMLGYSIQEFISNSIQNSIENINIEIEIKDTGTGKKKEEYIKYIAKTIAEKVKYDDKYMYFYQLDVENRDIECLIKGTLLYIFQDKKNADQDFRVAFINCKHYQILEIVRLIALYYNRQELNDKMKNVQIYIRGEDVGEELLLHGETLTTLRDNLALSACIKGTMYQNLHAINTILSRKNDVTGGVF